VSAAILHVLSNVVQGQKSNCCFLLFSDPMIVFNEQANHPHPVRRPLSLSFSLDGDALCLFLVILNPSLSTTIRPHASFRPSDDAQQN
jgi:hypothetical protein